MADLFDRLIDRGVALGDGRDPERRAFSSNSRDLWIREWDEVKDTGDLPRIERPYLQGTTVKAAVDRIGRSLRSVPVKFFEGEREISTGPVVQVFNRPNPNLDGAELIEGTAIFLEICGDVVWGLDKFIGRVPGEIHLLHPESTEEKVDDDGMLEAWENRRSVRGRRRTRVFLRDEAVHFRYFNPYDEIRGIPTLTGGNLSVATDIYAKLMNAEFFRNSATISGILSSGAAVNDDILNAALRKFLAGHRGIGNSKKVLALSGDWKFNPIAPTHSEMEFKDQQELSREETASGYGVPPVELGILKFVNYATATIQRRMFWENRIIPLGRYVQRKANEDLLARRGISTRILLDFDDVEALRENFAEKLAWAEILARIGYPLNEINRALDLGLPDLPWGDEALVPFNLIPASALVDGGGPPRSAPAEEGRGVVDLDAILARIRGRIEAARRPVEVREDAPEGPDGPEAADPTEGEGSPADVEDRFPASLLRTEKARREFWKVFFRRVAPIERRFERAMGRFLRGLRAEVVRNLAASPAIGRGDVGPRARRKGPIEDWILAELMFDEAAAVEALRVLARPHFRSAVQAGADSLIAEINVDPFELRSPEAESFIATKEIKIADDVIPPVKRAIVASLAQGLAAGENLTSLADRVNESFETSTVRARRIARTEIGQAANGGHFIAMKEEGVERHEWLSSRDSAVRDSHAKEDGNIVNVGDAFPVTGLRYPLDIASNRPEEVVNCRCIALAAR